MRVYGLKYGEPQLPGWQPDGSYMPNEYFMQMAIKWAGLCVEQGQHPVGAVVTRTVVTPPTFEGTQREFEFVAGVGVNEVVTNSSMHAERIALDKAEAHHGGRRRLHDLMAVMYTTHEPCPMCAGFVANSKLKGIVYGTSNEDALKLVSETGMKWRANQVSGLAVIRGRIETGMPGQFIIGGFMREQCLDLLKTAGRLSAAPLSTGPRGLDAALAKANEITIRGRDLGIPDEDVSLRADNVLLEYLDGTSDT